MQYKNKIKLFLLLSIVAHALLISIIKFKPQEEPPQKEKRFDIVYYKQPPAVKPKPIAKKSVKPPPAKPDEPKPLEAKVVKKIVKPKRVVPPKKKIKVVKKLPDKTEFTLDRKKIVQKQVAPKPSVKKSLPPPQLEKRPEVLPLENKDASSKTPDDNPPKKHLDARTKVQPKVKEEEFALLRKLLEREEAEKKHLQQPAEKSTLKKPLEARVAKLMPSMKRLSELDRIEREHTRGMGDSEMESVYLNSMDVRYVSYLDNIKLAIELAWNYPEAAARQGIEGNGALSFTIGKDGVLREIKILRTTGSQILDDRFVRAVKMASPFPPLPENIKTKKLKINATYRYILSIVY